MERRFSHNRPARPLVLIVESHEDTRALYAIALSGMGFEAIAEGNCANAHSPAWDKPCGSRRTAMRGVQPSERWDYFECRTCGPFVYRDRTRKLRRTG